MSVNPINAKPVQEKFEGYAVKGGRVQGSFYQYQSTIAKVQEKYDTAQTSKRVRFYQVPGNVIKSILCNVRNVLNSIINGVYKLLTSCLPDKADKAEKVAKD